MGGGLRGLGKKGEEIKKYKLVVTKQLQGCTMHSTGNIVTNTVITMYSARWVQEIQGEALLKL